MILSTKINNFSIIIGILIVFAVIYTIACPTTDHWKGLNDLNDSTLTDKFFNRLYFSLTTMTTIGFGDITPVSKTARSLVMLQMFTIILKILFML